MKMKTNSTIFRFSFILFVFVYVCFVCFLCMDPSGLIQNKWNEMEWNIMAGYQNSQLAHRAHHLL